MQPNKKTSSCLQELSCPQLQEKLSLEIMKDYWGLVALYGMDPLSSPVFCSYS